MGTLYQQLRKRFGARFRAGSGTASDVSGEAESALAQATLIRAGASPLQAQRETLDLVCATLAGASVPFFCVRPMAGWPPAVAVDAEHRAQALEALARRPEPLFAGRQPDGRHAHRPAVEPDMRPLSQADVADATVVRLAVYFTAPSRTLMLGPEHGCDLEFWTGDGDLLVAPRPNRCAETVLARGPNVEAGEELFNSLVAGWQRARTYPTRPEFTRLLVDDIDFPIDAVYTWVDGGDPVWRARKETALTGRFCDIATTDSRFTSRDELRYSLRSLMMYAPWIRRVWLVTDGQRPSWLEDGDRVKVVDHKEIFADPSVLPVFNSHAIESQLHHIDGLAEHFVYMNDDFFLGRPLYPHTFFEGNGVARFFPSTAQVPFDLLEENPVHAAGMNNRRMMESLTGRTLTRKMKHVPYALRRSLIYELEERFPAEFAATAASTFRQSTDISVASSLAHYYAYLTRRAIPGQIEYTYVDLAVPRTPIKLRRMLNNRDHDAFCINDTSPTSAQQDQALMGFLEAYYPTPAPFEGA
ncbi:stealth conserved region 3 domain-containing protein [Streptosporangiaceae bacterium NEAU-GS5]|nr:stealth conserved region 3 domain-containing protein [Streptosporangiaceae bacterium NEAU-GS5]